MSSWEVEGPLPEAVPWYHTAFAALFLFVWAFWVTGRAQENRLIVFFWEGGASQPSLVSVIEAPQALATLLFQSKRAVCLGDSLMPSLLGSLCRSQVLILFP